MRAAPRLVSSGVFAIGTAFGLGASPASAQGFGPGGSLGGYGAASGFGTPGMGSTGGGGAMIIPYGGRTEGFMPGRMGGNSPLSFRPRRSAGMGPSRASFGLSPMSGGMGRSLGARPSMSAPPGSRGGMGLGGGRPRSGSGEGGMGVMPPSIGYPFRQPPSLLAPSSGTPGMPM